MESFLSYRGSPKSSTIFGWFSSLIPSGKRLQKPNWKDPPCYSHGKIHDKSMAMFNIFQFANCWHNQRVSSNSHPGVSPLPLRPFGHLFGFCTWIQHDGPNHPGVSTCSSPSLATMAAMAETMPSSVEASETVDETMPSEDQVCKRCLPGLVSTLTKTELERSTRLGYHGKTHEISMGHKQNSYVTVITRGYPTSLI